MSSVRLPDDPIVAGKPLKSDAPANQTSSSVRPQDKRLRIMRLPPWANVARTAIALALAGQCAATALAFASLTSGGVHQTDSRSSKDRSPTYHQLALFGEVLEQVRNRHVSAPKEPELIRSAIEGMFTALDVHSAYLPAERFDEMRRQNSGTFGGLGIEVTIEGGTVVVTSPIDDTPAARAGMMANDRVIEVDGQSTSGRTLEQMSAMLLGEVGTDVNIVVAREGRAEPIRLKLTRETIILGTAKLSYERDVPVISLSSFSEQSRDSLEDAIHKVASADKPPSGIILDLRNNAGGPLDQARQVADAFLSQGAIFYSRGRDGSQTKRYAARPDEVDELIAGVPLIVLINGGTASAAEIVSGALQDHRRATLVGTRSFGKGVVQTVVSLDDNAAMSLTTARVYTPSGRSIQALGIAPDIEVVQSVPAALHDTETVAGEAGLERHLPGEQGEATVRSSVYVPASRAEDDQLRYAVKLVLGEVHQEALP